MNDDQGLPAGGHAGRLTPAVAYLRQYGSMTCNQLAQAKKRLAAFAGQHGFELCEVFVEERHSDPAAFHCLLQLIKRQRIQIVLVPNHAHLSAVGGGETKAQRLRRETGFEALVTGESAP